MRRRLTTALLLLAFLAGGGLRPGVNPSCPHHGGDASPPSRAAEAGSTTSHDAGVAHSHADPAGLAVAVGQSAEHDHGADEGVPCTCGSSCLCVQARTDDGLLPATLPTGPRALVASRRGILPRADEATPPDRARRLLPWPTGPPTL